MNISTVSELFEVISESVKNLSERDRSISLRKRCFASISKTGFIKEAFDTRRIDQETEYNPRRGLQNYNRSASFISEAMEQKLVNFAKLRKVLNNLKEIYGKEAEWQDSNARVLLSTIDKGLRTGLNDGDFSESQPGVGSLDYIEELLHVRYRLGFDELSKIAESDLKHVILSKDEELTRRNINKDLEITKHDVATQNYDSLMEKLFGGVRASKECPEVERTVTITIKDKFVE